MTQADYGIRYVAIYQQDDTTLYVEPEDYFYDYLDDYTGPKLGRYDQTRKIFGKRLMSYEEFRQLTGRDKYKTMSLKEFLADIKATRERGHYVS